MYFLSVDFTKCDDCFKCEEVLPGFRTIWGGLLPVNRAGKDDEELRASADLVKSTCPNGAIIFKESIY